ncbi:MAG: HesA/MoeB/ThiF family protein [Pseudomonadota bacterium]
MLKYDIRKFSEVTIAPNGKEYVKISLPSIKNFAKTHNLEIAEVEILALENGIIPERYQRNIGTIGLKGQAKLLNSKIVIIGLGGLGGTVLEILARVGIGWIVAVDGDVFDESNLNRQILAKENKLGSRKTDAALERVKSINQAIRVEAHFTRIKDDNIRHIISGADVIVDALDNIPSRLLVEKAAKAEGIPLVHGAVAGFSGQVSTIFPEDRGLQEIYGSPGKLPKSGIESELGTPSTTPAMVASWQAQETIKILLGEGELLRNRLLCIDGQGGTVEIVRLDRK